MMDIAERLDKAMKDVGIASQAALSRISGVPQPTINRILKGHGKKGPETDTLMKLAAACKVTFEWLREGIEPQSSAKAPSANTAGGSDDKASRGTNTQPDDESLRLAIRLLMLFHGTDRDGRARIMKVAEKAPQISGIGLVSNQA